MKIAEQLVATLPVGESGLFNPWKERCAFDSPFNAPEARLERLARHLDCNAKLILVGEAPGYQGCRYSGIAFTSERLLLEGAIPRIDRIDHRLSTRERPFSEPSATIVWKALYQYGVAEETILWNAMQLHPFMENNEWSNRTPTDDEIRLGSKALKLLRESFQEAVMVAVGRKAEAAMAQIGIQTNAAIRHPANGGAREFTEGLGKALRGA